MLPHVSWNSLKSQDHLDGYKLSLNAAKVSRRPALQSKQNSTLAISFFCCQSLDARIIIGEFSEIGARNVFCEVSSP